MKTQRRAREYLTAGLFLIVLFAGTAFWLSGRYIPEDNYAGMQSASKADMLSETSDRSTGYRATPTRLATVETPEIPTQEEVEAIPEEVEAALNDTLDRDRLFIQFYGGIQQILGRRIMNDAEEEYTVYKLSDGSLTFVEAEPAGRITERAEAYLEFQDTLEENGIPLLYLQAPQKVGGDGTPTLPPDVVDYGNENANQFISLITEGGGSVLDFRDVLTEDGNLWTSYFFATDHHWTPEAALLCVNALVKHLNLEYDMNLSPARTAPSLYSKTVYEDCFLGSQGKRTGSLYAGLDDFTVLSPVFETDFTYTIQTTVRKGSFDECLVFPERLEETDPFLANPYTYYSGGDYSFSRIINHDNPDGPKIMILRDSFACVFTPFLAQHCSDLSIVDLRHFYDDFQTYIDWLDPDMILMLYTPGSLENEMAFDFFSRLNH